MGFDRVQSLHLVTFTQQWVCLISSQNLSEPISRKRKMKQKGSVPTNVLTITHFAPTAITPGSRPSTQQLVTTSTSDDSVSRASFVASFDKGFKYIFFYFLSSFSRCDEPLVSSDIWDLMLQRQFEETLPVTLAQVYDISLTQCNKRVKEFTKNHVIRKRKQSLLWVFTRLANCKQPSCTTFCNGDDSLIFESRAATSAYPNDHTNWGIFECLRLYHSDSRCYDKSFSGSKRKACSDCGIDLHV
jgi:hypothetical protein